MDRETLLRERAAIVERYGAWTAHNIHLGDGVYTLSAEPAGDEVKLRRVTQIVSDVVGGRLEGARILDLACLEGMYALELARRGAHVVAVEGREANLEKARFAGRALGIEGVDFRLGDVRDVNREQDGEFDVVLCLGILYHLDAPDLFTFVERLAAMSTRALVVDTAVADREHETVAHDGFVYAGQVVVEHAPTSTDDERLEAVWSSLDNVNAFALTRPSLLTLLARAGFTSVYECQIPAEPEKELHRVTYLALKGEPVGELLAPAPPTDAAVVPEERPLKVTLPATRLWTVGGRALPPSVRRRIRTLLGAETRRH